MSSKDADVSLDLPDVSNTDASAEDSGTFYKLLLNVTKAKAGFVAGQ